MFCIVKESDSLMANAESRMAVADIKLIFSLQIFEIMNWKGQRLEVTQQEMF